MSDRFFHVAHPLIYGPIYATNFILGCLGEILNKYYMGPLPVLGLTQFPCTGPELLQTCRIKYVCADLGIGEAGARCCPGKVSLPQQSLADTRGLGRHGECGEEWEREVSRVGGSVGR